jgi:hypothetical protein
MSQNVKWHSEIKFETCADERRKHEPIAKYEFEIVFSNFHVFKKNCEGLLSAESFASGYFFS